MTDTWKQLERDVAEASGGKRIPASGAAQFEGELGDVFHPTLEIECKYRDRKFGVVTVFEQVRERAKKSGKTPLLVIQQKGMDHGKFVLMDLRDWKAMYQQANPTPKEVVKNGRTNTEQA